jgi:hypothetical protein
MRNFTHILFFIFAFSPLFATAEETKHQPFDGKDISNLNSAGSIMFERGSLDFLYGKIFSNNKKTDEKKTEVKIDNSKILDSNGTSPSFYLSSMIFINEKDWTVWISGQKMRVGDENPNMKIIGINNKKVDVIWSGKSLDNLSPRYKDILTKLVEGGVSYSADLGNKDSAGNNFEMQKYNWDYKSADGKILVDSISGAVKFTLEKNQSFSLYDMEIVEGYKASTPLQLTPAKSVEENKQENILDQEIKF